MKASAESAAVVRTRPSLWFIPLRSIGVTLGLILLGLAMLWLAGWAGRADVGFGVSIWCGRLAWLAFVAAGGRVLWDALEWSFRRYELTADRVRVTGGVLARYGNEVALSRVHSMHLHKSLLQRVVGVGNIGVATAGTGGVEVVWAFVARPEARLEQIRAAVDRVREVRA